jgi:hypothetical protein
VHANCILGLEHCKLCRVVPGHCGDELITLMPDGLIVVSNGSEWIIQVALVPCMGNGAAHATPGPWYGITCSTVS